MGIYEPMDDDLDYMVHLENVYISLIVIFNGYSWVYSWWLTLVHLVLIILVPIMFYG